MYALEDWLRSVLASQFRKLGFYFIFLSVGFYYPPAIKTIQWYSRHWKSYLEEHKQKYSGNVAVANAEFPGNGPISPKKLEITSLSNSTETFSQLGAV